MKWVFITLLLFYISTTKGNILKKLSDNLRSIFKNTNDTAYENKATSEPNAARYFNPSNDVTDEESGRKDRNLHKRRRFEDNKIDRNDVSSPELKASLGISNEDIERRAAELPDYRRYVREDLNRNYIYSRSVGLTSTSADEKDWKREYKYRWYSMKKDAVLTPLSNITGGDVVNMAAARPWRVPCGDPSVHNIAASSCTLPYECPPEFRIYKGDKDCGRTTYVCCGAEILNNRDMYEALREPTLTDTSQFSTSSDELIKAAKSHASRERRLRKRQRKRNRTLKARFRRKRFIKKTIRKLAKLVRKELNRAFRNATAHRRIVINRLKELIRNMKEKYRNERHLAKFHQDLDLANINLKLTDKLQKIRGLNYNFLTNDTFRKIIINGSATRQGVKPLFEAYPELNSDYYLDQVVPKTRRSGGAIPDRKKRKRRPHRIRDYLDYDIEFGMFI